MTKLLLASIAASNYWPQVRALAASLGRYAPEVQLHALVMDATADRPQLPAEPNVIQHGLADLPLPPADNLATRFSITERATAVKPAFLRFLFEHHNPTNLAYLDPDLYFCHSPLVIAERLQDADILLTPHFTDLTESGGPERDIQFMRGGTYNLGFIGLRDGPNVRRLLDWWSERTLRYCSEDSKNDVFTDQRWVDLVPGLFPGVRVERHPGFNLAPWNLLGRPIERGADGYTVRGQPLIFFHFSKYHPNRTVAQFLDGRPCTAAAEQLFAEYRETLLAKKSEATAATPAAAPLDLLPNGERVPALLRRVLRDLNGRGDALLRTPPTAPADVLRRLVTEADTAGLVHAYTYHLHLQRRAGGVEAQVERYSKSRLFRWWVDAWFYCFGPQTLKIPIDWVEPNSVLRRMRASVGATVRLAKRLARGGRRR